MSGQEKNCTKSRSVNLDTLTDKVTGTQPKVQTRPHIRSDDVPYDSDGVCPQVDVRLRTLTKVQKSRETSTKDTPVHLPLPTSTIFLSTTGPV